MIINYTKLEADYNALTEKYSKSIEQSHEVSNLLSKDIFELNSNFRNATDLQIDSQDGLRGQLEKIIF
jgi:hypothetical protein